jgi:hypothetical protein
MFSYVLPRDAAVTKLVANFNSYPHAVTDIGEILFRD